MQRDELKMTVQAIRTILQSDGILPATRKEAEEKLAVMESQLATLKAAPKRSRSKSRNRLTGFPGEFLVRENQQLGPFHLLLWL